MEIGIIVSIISLFLGISYFIFPRFYDRFYKRPKLTMEIEPAQGITAFQKFIAYSSENDPDLPVNRPDAIATYHFEWNFNIIVRNNSEVNAYNVKLLQHRNHPKLQFKEKINPNKALRAHQEEVVPFIFGKIVKTELQNREKHFTKEPAELQDLMILLEYENQFGIKFYSKYYFNTHTTEFEKLSNKNLNFWI